MTQRAKQLIPGVAAGILLGIGGLVLGLPGMSASVVAIAVIGVVARGVAAGGLIGLGGTWLVLFVNAAGQCAGPGQPCGATPLDVTPHVLVSAALLATGFVVAIKSGRGAPAARPSSR